MEAKLARLPVCVSCGETFFVEADLLEHDCGQTLHRVNDMWPCRKCDLSFNQLCKLKVCHIVKQNRGKV